MNSIKRKRIRVKLKHLFDSIKNEQIKTSILNAIPFWIASIITGLVAVAYTKLFNFSESLLHKTLGWHSWLIFILAPANFLIAWYLVKTLAPNARGSGIPQVMAAIDLSAPRYEKRIPKLLSIRILLTKIASSIFMVFGGGAIGREGPTIQIAGSIFLTINKWIPESWPKLSKKNFLITGAAAGLAAAFNTPLGGIIFAIEELAYIHISNFRTALFSAVIIAGLVAQGLLGPYLYLGYPDVKNSTSGIFLGVAACAVITGCLGSLMCKMILRVMKWKRGLSQLKTIAFIIAAGLIIASVAYFINDHILGAGKDLMSDFLFTDQKHVTLITVLARIAGPVLSFNVGGAGGVFAPALAAGASVGAYLSGMFGVIGANANILILSGMVGFLTGVTRTPFTSAILVLEMTDRHEVIFHLIIAAMISGIAAMLTEKQSFYSQLKKIYVDDVKAGDLRPA